MRSQLAVLIFLASVHLRAQVSGDTLVCPAHIHTFEANIPGAVDFTWSFPSGWYEVSGQGTAQVSVTVNVHIGQVCVEGFDEGSLSLGVQCMAVDWGGDGAGWDLQPTNVFGCEDVGYTNTGVEVVPNGTGSVCGSCGGGVEHPDVAFALYDNEDFTLGHFIAFADGTLITFYSGAMYHVFRVDHSNGLEYPEAVLIEGGCGGVVNNTFAAMFFPPQTPLFSQVPSPACIGDTIEVWEFYSVDWYPYEWSPVDLDVIGSWGGMPLIAVITGPNASVYYHGGNAFGCSVDGTMNVEYCLTTPVAGAQGDPRIVLLPLGDDHYALECSGLFDISVFSSTGHKLMESRGAIIDLSAQPAGLYIVEVRLQGGGRQRLKIVKN